MSPPDAVGEQPWPWGESDTRCQFAGGRGTSRAKCRSPRVPFASGRYRTRMCGNPDARHGRAVRQFPIYNRAVVNWTNPAKLSQTPQCGRSSRHAWPRSARPQTRSRSLKMADDRLRRLARRCGLCPLHEPLARPRRAGHHHHLQWRRPPGSTSIVSLDPGQNSRPIASVYADRDARGAAPDEAAPG
jgi:hypothetical protein